MSGTAEIRMIRASRLVYSGLLFMYPRDLRRRFGIEMSDDFEDSLRAALGEHGVPGAAAMWGIVLWELVSVAVPSRLATTTAMAAAVSCLASSVLFWVLLSAAN